MTTKEELITEYATKFRRALVCYLGIEKSVKEEENINNLGNAIKEYLENFYDKAKEPETAEQYGRWKPKEGETYYFLSDDERPIPISCTTWGNDNEDKNLYSIGNCYQTYKQTEQALERLKIRTQLEDIALRLNKGRVFDWNSKSQDKYVLLYDHDAQKVTQDVRAIYQTNDIHCLDENFKDVAISEIGEERLAKYLKEE